MNPSRPPFDHQHLVNTFDAIGNQHMRDLPVFNAALSAYTPGFIEYDGHWVGVVITPWFMNVIALPIASVPHSDAKPEDSKLSIVLPNGEFEFSKGPLPELGDYYTCSLLSPVFDFETQADAVMAAQAAMREIFTPPPQKQFSRRSLLRGSREEHAHE